MHRVGHQARVVTGGIAGGRGRHVDAPARDGRHHLPCVAGVEGRLGEAVARREQGHRREQHGEVPGQHAGHHREPTRSAPMGRRKPIRATSRYHARVPTLRPFRALRYAAAIGPDLSAVVCPPYDIIPAALGVALRERDPYNAVRVELPDPEPGGDPDSRYRAAARALAEWRTAGVLVKERQPSIYIHEMTWDGVARAHARARAGGVRAAAAGAVRAGQRCPGPRADDDRPQGGSLPAAQGHRREPEPRDPAQRCGARARHGPARPDDRDAARRHGDDRRRCPPPDVDVRRDHRRVGPGDRGRRASCWPCSAPGR